MGNPYFGTYSPEGGLMGSLDAWKKHQEALHATAAQHPIKRRIPKAFWRGKS